MSKAPYYGKYPSVLGINLLATSLCPSFWLKGENQNLLELQNICSSITEAIPIAEEISFVHLLVLFLVCLFNFVLFACKNLLSWKNALWRLGLRVGLPVHWEQEEGVANWENFRSLLLSQADQFQDLEAENLETESLKTRQVPAQFF